MAIVGFNFTKIEAERLEAAKGKINVSNNVTISKVEEKNLALGNDKQKVLAFTFEFTSNYEPKVGQIKLTGETLFMDDSKKAKEVLDGWKKEKKLPKEIMTGIINAILGKCNIQSLILSEQVNLPAPIPLPRVQSAQQQSS